MYANPPPTLSKKNAPHRLGKGMFTDSDSAESGYAGREIFILAVSAASQDIPRPGANRAGA
jgi:hypothetical protein